MGKRKLHMVTRKAWGGRPPPEDAKKLKLPVKYIYVTHTSTPKCKTYEECCNTLNVLQQYYCEKKKNKDLPFNFMVSSRRFFEGRGWNVNGISEKINKMERAKNIMLKKTIDNFIESLNICKDSKESPERTAVMSTVDPDDIITALEKKESLDIKPPSQGISIAYIDDFLRSPKFGSKRCLRLLDFIMVGIEKKLIHQDFNILIDEGIKKRQTEALDYLWKGKEHTPEYKMAMEIRKLNEEMPDSRFEMNMLNFKTRKVKSNIKDIHK